MINYVKEIWKQRFKKHKDPLNRNIYVVRSGTYKGEFFVYINTNEEVVNFLSLPNNNPIEMTKDKFDVGLKNKIVELIEKLPYNVYEICQAQYNEAKAKSNINRLKQPVAPSSVDR